MARTTIRTGETRTETVIVGAGDALLIEAGARIQIRRDDAVAATFAGDARLINAGEILGTVEVSGNAAIVNRGTGQLQQYGAPALIIDGDLLLTNDGGAIESTVFASGTIDLRNLGMGTITASRDGVHASGGTIVNSAEALIGASWHGVLIDDGVGGGASGSTRIVNDGTIRGNGGEAIQLVGNHDDVVINRGTLSASNSRIMLDAGDGDDRIVNSGTIMGEVVLGDGDDLLINRGTIYGVINAGAGDDRIIAGPGNYTIIGGSGRDVLTGGAGSDRFYFLSFEETSARLARADRITDFNMPDGDVIMLDRIDAHTTIDGDQAFTFIGTAAFSGVAGELRSEVVGRITAITGDVDGDGAADFAIVLTGHYQPGDLQFIL